MGHRSRSKKILTGAPRRHKREVSQKPHPHAPHDTPPPSERPQEPREGEQPGWLSAPGRSASDRPKRLGSHRQPSEVMAERPPKSPVLSPSLVQGALWIACSSS